jgi:hypothetical protein
MNMYEDPIVLDTRQSITRVSNEYHLYISRVSSGYFLKSGQSELPGGTLRDSWWKKHGRGSKISTRVSSGYYMKSGQSELPWGTLGGRSGSLFGPEMALQRVESCAEDLWGEVTFGCGFLEDRKLEHQNFLGDFWVSHHESCLRAIPVEKAFAWKSKKTWLSVAKACKSTEHACNVKYVDMNSSRLGLTESGEEERVLGRHWRDVVGVVERNWRGHGRCMGLLQVAEEDVERWSWNALLGHDASQSQRLPHVLVHQSAEQAQKCSKRYHYYHSHDLVFQLEVQLRKMRVRVNWSTWCNNEY